MKLINRLFIVSVYLVTMTGVSCTTYPSSDYSSSSSSKKFVSVSHNVGYDLAEWKNRRSFCLPVIIADQSYIQSYSVARQMPAMLESISGKLNIPPYQQIVIKFTRGSIARKYSNMTQVFLATGEIPVPVVKSIASEIGFDSAIIPVITRAEIDSSRSDMGGIDKSGSIEIKLLFIDLKSSAAVKSFELTSSKTESYDTPSSVAYKRRMKENALRDFDRSVEREKKKTERERKRSEKKNGKPSAGEVVLDSVLDVMDDYDNGKQREKIENSREFEIHSTTIPGNSEFLMSMFLNTMGKVISDFDKLFDGTTVSGNCITGSGIFEFTNGDRYSGEWKDGLAHGKGLITFHDTWQSNGKTNIFGIFEEGTLIEELNPDSLPGSNGGVDTGN